jgi:hypothetical protein
MGLLATAEHIVKRLPDLIECPAVLVAAAVVM